jgi:hypothetical protein
MPASHQSPAPGFGKKNWNLSGLPSQSLESGGGGFFIVMFGQTFANSAFSRNHFSSPGSVSGLIASTGHSGTQTPQSMHSSMDDEHVLALIEAVHRTYFDAIHDLATNAVLVDDISQLSSLRHIACGML